MDKHCFYLNMCFFFFRCFTMQLKLYLKTEMRSYPTYHFVSCFFMINIIFCRSIHTKLIEVPICINAHNNKNGSWNLKRDRHRAGKWQSYISIVYQYWYQSTSTNTSVLVYHQDARRLVRGGREDWTLGLKYSCSGQRFKEPEHLLWWCHSHPSRMMLGLVEDQEWRDVKHNNSSSFPWLTTSTAQPQSPWKIPGSWLWQSEKSVPFILPLPSPPSCADFERKEWHSGKFLIRQYHWKPAKCTPSLQDSQSFPIPPQHTCPSQRQKQRFPGFCLRGGGWGQLNGSGCSC